MSADGRRTDLNETNTTLLTDISKISHASKANMELIPRSQAQQWLQEEHERGVTAQRGLVKRIEKLFEAQKSLHGKY